MGPTHIAVLNFLLAIFVLGFLYFKRHWHPLVIILILSVLPLISIFRPGSYQSGDMQIHATKTLEFTSAIIEGNLIPRWSGNLNATYGYPLWEFTYSTPYYLTTFLHLSGFSALTSVKLFLVITFLLSGVGMFLAAKRHLSDQAALVTTIFYQFAPYHLVDLHYRVAIGELAALTILPWCFYFINRKLLLPAGLSVGFLVLSHPAISLLSFPLLLVYSFKFLAPLFFGLGISAFYWLPVILESQFTLRHIYPVTITLANFKDLLFSPWYYGLLFQGPMGQLSPSIGIVQLLLLVPAVYLAFRFRKLLVYMFIFLIYFFTISNFSAPIWNLFPFLQNIQFSYRLLGPLMLISSAFSGMVISFLPKSSKLPFILISLVILTSSANWANRKMLTYIDDQFLRQNLPFLTATSGMSEGIEATPVWVDPKNPWHLTPPISHLEIITGQALVTPISRTSTHHSYIVVVDEATNFQENTLYFPGWQLFVNNISRNFSYPNGVISFSLSPGIYTVDLKFSDTPIRSYSKTISLLFLVLLIFVSTPRFYNILLPLHRRP